MTHILIEDIIGGPLRSKCGCKSSLAPMHKTHATCFEAMIQQKLDIKTAINAIVKMAKCKVGGDNELKNCIIKKVDNELARLIASGNTNWTEVCFGESEEHEERVQAAADAEQEATAAQMKAAVQAHAARAAEAAASQA